MSQDIDRRNIIGAGLLCLTSIIISVVCYYPWPASNNTSTSTANTAAQNLDQRVVQLTGRVLNSKTKRPVHNASVVLEISGETTYVTDSQGIFTVFEKENELSKDFVVTVYCPGYKVKQLRVRPGIEASKFGTIYLDRE